MAYRLDQWLILELNDTLENTSYREIEAAIITTFGDNVEYFIPIYHENVGTYISTSVLMEGYAFIKDCLEVRNNIPNLREHRVFSKVLCYSGKFQTVTSDIIVNLKKKLKSSLKRRFPVNSRVKILEGIFKNLIGDVVSVEENGRIIMVRIKRLSREIIAPIPATLLEEIQENL